MRLQNFLNEQRMSDDDINYIKQHCKEYLKDLSRQSVTGTPYTLWSGRQATTEVIYRNIRTSRRPIDTPKEVQEIIDNTFKEKLGIKPRSQSLFCYSDKTLTIGYGTAYAIFPQGRYHLKTDKDAENMAIKFAKEVS